MYQRYHQAECIRVYASQALKLHYWSSLAYSDLGQEAATRLSGWVADDSAPESPAPQAGLLKARLRPLLGAAHGRVISIPNCWAASGWLSTSV